ncbi:MAG: YraN family protein [Patescibacteria group bacterium]|nr:YraN family protein [Patescibacteria group bacterium]MDE2438834.1 YraN family protein [Patescibacteria group bacterium]
MNTNRITGNIGERIAEQYLIKQGYHILEHNYWKPFGEIDIVARIRTLIVCVEVKTSRGEIMPGWQMTPHKLQKFKRIIETYIMEKRLSGKRVRADAILINLKSGAVEYALEHIEGIELP